MDGSSDNATADGQPSAQQTASAPPAESTVGTGSVFAIGCTILALLITCIGVAIFMWRQVN